MCAERPGTQPCQGIYHLATFQRSGGGGEKIRLSTRLNQLNASRILLVEKFSRPASLCYARLRLLERAASREVDGVSMLLSFMRQEKKFWFFFTARSLLQSTSSCCQRFAMASKKNAKVHVKAKGGSQLFFLCHSVVVAVAGMTRCSLQLSLAGLSKLIGCQAVISFRALVLAS